MLRQKKNLFKMLLLVLFLASGLILSMPHTSLSVHATNTENSDNDNEGDEENPTEPPTETPSIVDKKELETLIHDAEQEIQDNKDNYTPTSIADLETALTAAKEIFDKEDALQSEVDNTKENLSKAISALVKRGDKTELKKSISNAEKYEKEYEKDNDLYTANSYKSFSKALATAKEVLENADSIQDVVDAAQKNLDDAIKKLIKKPRYTQIGNTQYYNLSDFFTSDPEHWYRTTDDEFFQWALDKAGSDHFTEIYVPAGTYRIYNTLLIHSNTTLRLDPGAVIIRMDTTTNMLRTSDTSGKSNTAGGYSLAQNINITGGVWDGGNIAAANTATNLLYLGHSSNVTISNTTIRNCNGAHALELAGVSDAVVSGCQIYGFAYSYDNNLFTSEAIELDVCGSASWTPGYVIDNTGCQNIVIENNIITDYPRGIGSHHVANGKTYNTYTNITIRNNTFNRSSAGTQNKCQAAIRLEGVQNATITGNRADYYSYGIYFKNSSGLTVKKNTLKYNGTAHILYTGCKGIKNQSIKFTVTQKKLKTKVAKFKSPTMKTGYVKVKGKKYTFKKIKSVHTVNLKTKIKKNQKWTFYGKDKNGNKFFYNYTVPKK